MPDILFLLLFVAIAGLVQGTVGFGFGLVAMSTLPLFIDVKEAVPTVGLLCLVSNSLLCWRLRHHMERKKILPLLIGCLIGVPVGVTLFTSLDTDILLMILGVALIAVAIQQQFKKTEDSQPNPNPPHHKPGVVWLASRVGYSGAHSTRVDHPC